MFRNMVKFIINRPDRDKPQEWDVSYKDLRLTLKDIIALRTDFNYIDRIEITFNDNIKSRSNSKAYAFPDKYT